MRYVPRWYTTNEAMHEGRAVTVLSFELFAPCTPDALVKYEDGREAWVNAQELRDAEREA